MSFLSVFLLFLVALAAMTPLALLVYAFFVVRSRRAWYLGTAGLRAKPSRRQLRAWRRGRLEVPAQNRRSR